MPPAGPKNDNVASASYSAPAAEKALEILEALSAQPGGATISELARLLGRSVGELYRIAHVLERRDYIIKDKASERFHLSLRFFELAHAHPFIDRLLMAAQPVLDALAVRSMQSPHLIVAEVETALVVAGGRSTLDMQYAVRVGARFPLLETSSGMVLVAFQAIGVGVDLRALGGQHRDLVDPERIGNIRDLGYEVWDSQIVRGVTNLSVPVRDGAGQVCAALTIPYLEQSRATPTRSEALAMAGEAAEGISRALRVGMAPERRKPD